ncbi:hypothetical protein R6Q57_015523 [Mikania cordata]
MNAIIRRIPGQNFAARHKVNVGSSTVLILGQNFTARHKVSAGSSSSSDFRGNTPYCSEDCRQEQIENDEARERRWKLSSKKSAETSKKPASVQTGTLVASN